MGFFSLFFDLLAIHNSRYGQRKVRQASIRGAGQLGTATRTVRAATSGRLTQRVAKRFAVKGIRRFLR